MLYQLGTAQQYLTNYKTLDNWTHSTKQHYAALRHICSIKQHLQH